MPILWWRISFVILRSLFCSFNRTYTVYYILFIHFWGYNLPLLLRYLHTEVDPFAPDSGRKQVPFEIVAKKGFISVVMYKILTIHGLKSYVQTPIHQTPFFTIAVKRLMLIVFKFFRFILRCWSCACNKPKQHTDFKV